MMCDIGKSHFNYNIKKIKLTKIVLVTRVYQWRIKNYPICKTKHRYIITKEVVKCHTPFIAHHKNQYFTQSCVKISFIIHKTAYTLSVSVYIQYTYHTYHLFCDNVSVFCFTNWVIFNPPLIHSSY